MAYKIKSVSKFSEDAINLAMDKMSESEKKNLVKGLDILSNSLGEKKSETRKTTKKITDESIFTNSVIPQILRRINLIEEREIAGKLTLDVDFVFRTDFDGLSKNDLLREHSLLVRVEAEYKFLTIFTQFARGKLYLSLVDVLNKSGQELKDFAKQELKVSYMTVLRYMTLASIISSYPRLLLCELSFAQILKHKTRLCKYLESVKGQELGDRLSLSVEVKINGKELSIKHLSVEMTENIKFNTNPDWGYHDANTDTETSGWTMSYSDVEDEETELLNTM